MAGRLIYVSAALRVTRVAAVVAAASRIISVAIATFPAAAWSVAVEHGIATTPSAFPIVTITVRSIRCCVAANKEALAELRKEDRTGGAGSHTSRRSTNRNPAAVDHVRRPPRP